MEYSQKAHELLCRTRDSIRVIRGLSSQEQIIFASPGFVCLYSKCGQKLGLVDLNGLRVLRTSDYSEIMFARRNNVQLLHFSRCSRYLVSWEKPVEDNKNLIIWDLNTGGPIYQFYSKKFLKELWPSIIFSFDSTHFFIKNGNDVHVYRIPDQQTLYIFNSVKVSSYFLSPRVNTMIVYSDSVGEGSLISVFLQQASSLEKTCELGIQNVQEIKVLWNTEGNRAVIWCQTDVDTTGRSYYGEHSLYMYTPEPKLKQIKTTEGPVHDVSWNPTDDEFIVIAGFMPATSHFYNLSGNKKNEISKIPRNTVKWNPFGSLFLIAGFGNLQGEVDIYERSTLNLIGNCKASSTVYCEWGPCGKVFVAATLCPRMRVDNGYCIYKYTGELLIKIFETSELWECVWLPQVFLFTPLTPTNKEKVVVEKKTYKPPGASTGFAAKFKAAKESAPGKLQIAAVPVAEDFIPGLALEPAKKKKKKKKPANK